MRWVRTSVISAGADMLREVNRVVSQQAPISGWARTGAVMQLRSPEAKLTSTVISGLPTPLSSPRL